MTKILAVFALLTLAACGRPNQPASGALCQLPFSDLETSGASPEDQLILREASEDFCAVVAGEKPEHAKLDPGLGPSDGGTLFYDGRHYRLTALNSLSTFGSFRGVAQGPILEFDKSFAPGHTSTVSHIRVYPIPETR